MPRMARLVVPYYPHHVVQRGHNRQRVFHGDEDFQRYLLALAEFKSEFQVKLHAWCLMSNHVHLLLAPQDCTGLARLMKRLAGRHTRYYNARARRTGTLWECRYKSSVVEGDHYLLACCRYIELNPVRAGMVGTAAEYPWSSFRARMGAVDSVLLDPDPHYLALGSSDETRRKAYRRLLDTTASAEEWERIRRGPRRGDVTGSDSFVEHISTMTGRQFSVRPPGRPVGYRVMK